ncbi:MAG: hypothetical protein J7J28_04920 [Thaumarchaeota archaeon]|nr:hypothetical protein [Nitrososphaerota archaeon]
MDKAVLDTSIVINGRFSKMLESGEIAECEIIIPAAVIDELQAQASKGRDVGFKGLEEVKRIRELAESKGLAVRFVGERPSLEDIKLARSGRIDALIRDVAKTEKGILYTSDYVQALVAEAEGIPVKYVEAYVRKERFRFEDYLTPETVLLEFISGYYPMAKIVDGDEVKLVKVGDKPLSEEEVNELIEEIIGECRLSDECGIMILKSGAMILQLRDYRVAVAKPPFSDKLELIVRRLSFKPRVDVKQLNTLIERVSDKSAGVLLIGAPESGVLELSKILMNMLRERGKMVRIVEYGRMLGENGSLTCYGPLEGDVEKTADFLIHLKPDYVILNDMSDSKDFKSFVKLRLAGIGVIGIIYADDPLQVLKRFVSRLELDLLAKTLNFLILAADKILKIYELGMVIRAPTGRDPTHVKPLVEVRALPKGDLEYEIYSDGGRLIIEVKKVKERVEYLRERAEHLIKQIRSLDPKASIEFVSLDKVVLAVDESLIPKLYSLRRSFIEENGVMLEFRARSG